MTPETQSNPNELSPLKRAFLALEAAQSKVAALQAAANEPVAVIGLGCRVPGADSPDGFWQRLCDGVDSVGPIPRERFDIDAYFDPDTEAPGRIAVREAAFLDGVDRFDPAFFGIAPREAQGMDPQQRLLLEVSWEALERAGIAPDRLERSATGVYFGVCSSDYSYLQLKSGDPALLDAHFTSGVAHSVASGRLSYLLGLQGPSLTIDTACSSSLVAVHLAVQALRSGDCRMALAGGVNVMLSPDLFIAFSHSRMLAPDGRCKTFDAMADGFGRGEGCGVVILKRLSDAVADRDPVLAVIRGTAVNQDGPSSGLTAPNGPAQEAVIEAALQRAGLSPAEVGYIEAHGTGTQLGDPLEVRALAEVFAAGRPAHQPLLLGSVKTNVGHLEAAAGIVGLIKVVLSLRHRQIPAHLHYRTPSPHIPWAELPFVVPTALTPWEPIGGRRVGGVSSFGFSGTNAHVVLEEAPTSLRADTVVSPPITQPGSAGLQLFCATARDKQALGELAARYARALTGVGDQALADLCYTANVGRATFAERAVISAASIDELRERLDSLAQGRDAAGLRTARVSLRDPPRIAFMFTGQGSQYAGMGIGLYRAVPAFREALDRCAHILGPRLSRPLLELLDPPEGRAHQLDETGVTQPVLFALEYALAQMWQSWGVSPTIVTGHSVGEYVAACVAGVMSLDDALGLVAERGRLMQSLPAGGAMAAVFADPTRIAAAVEPHAASVAIAAVNAPGQSVVSGASDAVAAVCARLVAEGVRCQSLPVSHAFHSPLVDPVLEPFERAASTVRFTAPRIRLISNLTGALADPNEIVRPDYWRRHLRGTVLFGQGLQSLAALRPDVCIEIGPHPTLLGFARATFGADGPVQLASMRRGADARSQALEALGGAFLAGVDVDWRGVYAGQALQIADLPTYPFRRDRFWFSARPVVATDGTRPTQHPLLGVRLRTATTQTIYQTTVSARTPGYVDQHRVQDRVVMPATAYLDALLAAGRDHFGRGIQALENVTIEQAMLIGDDPEDSRIVQVVLESDTGNGIGARLCSAPTRDGSQDWIRHVSATIVPTAPAAPRDAGAALASARAGSRPGLDHGAFYAELAKRGLGFGPLFQSVQQMWNGDGFAIGDVGLPDALVREASRYRIHPVLLDGCIQVLAAAFLGQSRGALFLPVGVGRYTVWTEAGLTRCRSHAIVRGNSGGESRRADLRVFDEQDQLVAELRDIQLQRVSHDTLGRLAQRWLADCLYEVDWRTPQTAPASIGDAVDLAELEDAANEAIRTLYRSVELDRYDAFLPQFDTLCADYVVQAMRSLGWNPAPGERVSDVTLIRRFGVLERHQRLVGRLLSILAEVGLLGRDADGWIVRSCLPAVDPPKESRRLLREYPEAAAELELTARVAAGLADALVGRADPLQLLFPSGSLDAAAKLYRDAPPARVFNGAMAEVVARAARTATAERPLRILELGAGTGGTTAHVLPRLAAHAVEYTFTDVGPMFVARAKERFSADPRLRFAVLDLEQEPAAQGFDGRTYDLVIASNVIHATRDLRRTLSRVRHLLAPGGTLALLEVTAAQRWFDVTVGLTEGWWCFEDHDLRRDYATLAADRWVALLERCGFESARAIPAGHGNGATLEANALLLARAGTTRSERKIGQWLVFADDGGAMAPVVARLRARGDRCVVVRARHDTGTAPDDGSIDPLSATAIVAAVGRFAAEAQGSWGVVYAWSLDAIDQGASRGQADRHQAVHDLRRPATSAMLLAQALVARNEVPRLWLVSRGAEQADRHDALLDPVQATVTGLSAALNLEHPELPCVSLDLDPAGDRDEADAVIGELDRDDRERRVALRRERGRCVARLVPLRADGSAAATARAGPYTLVSPAGGSLDALRLEPLRRRAPESGEVEVEVAATGLNFKDVLNVLGMYPGDPGPLGGEFAGRVTAVGAGVEGLAVGEEVLGLAASCFSSHVIARAGLVRRRPEGMSVEEGAGIPIAFLTAVYCLDHVARLRPGERVLIHAAAGGVGMAAVRIAQRCGAEVFATAGSPEKRALLRSMGVRHVMDSRSTAFAAEVLESTGGRGVDVVLNSLAGETIDASFRAIAYGGRFVEIGKRGIKTHEWVEALDRGLRYTVVDWGETALTDPDLIAGMLGQLVDELGSGALASLPRHVFPIDEASRAFRFMAQARHSGKVVVRHGAAATPAVRRDGSYLVTGGLSGLGLLVARWLAERGAGHLILVGRRGAPAEAEAELSALRELGVRITVEALDVGDGDGLGQLLERARRSGPPLRGVVHSAGVLDDAALVHQDEARFARVFAPKVHGAWLLDRLTRSDPLDFFVLFSSVAALLGSRGQANHSAANAYLDALARERQRQGLPGLSINWGAWTDVGAAADRGLTERMASVGLGAFSPQQGLSVFERLLGDGHAQVAALLIDWSRYVGLAHGGQPAAFLAEVATRSQSSAVAAPRQASAASLDMRATLRQAMPSRRRSLLSAFVGEHARRALGIDASHDLDPRMPLGELGLDSLLAVDLRNALGKALGEALSATLLFDYPTVDALTDYLLAEVIGPDNSGAAQPVSEPRREPSLVGEIEDLSDEEVDRQLAARAAAGR